MYMKRERFPEEKKFLRDFMFDEIDRKIRFYDIKMSSIVRDKKEIDIPVVYTSFFHFNNCNKEPFKPYCDFFSAATKVYGNLLFKYHVAGKIEAEKIENMKITGKMKFYMLLFNLSVTYIPSNCSFCRFYDTDGICVNSFGMTDISEIFKDTGKEHCYKRIFF